MMFTLFRLFRRALRARMPAVLAVLALCGGLQLPALAQLRLPSLPTLPSLPPPSLPTPAQATTTLQRSVPPVGELVRVRQQRIGEMLRERSALLEADPAGEPAVRGQVLLSSPTPELMRAALAEGFSVVRERVLDPLDLRIVTLRAPPQWDTPRAVQRLRELDPQAAIDFNHLYLESGEAGAPRGPMGVPGSNAAASPARSGAGAANLEQKAAAGIRIGLIDGGVETTHPLLRHAAIRAWGCGGRKVASAHGTAVASLLVGRGERFRSAAPAATLFAADVYCDDPIGGSIEAVAAALAWLIGEQVGVVNISLVGPANRTLEQVVRRATARGVLLVAAVGNDGPAAAPLYPAAWPEVVAVTGIDARGQVLPEAGRGPHVAFAAPGADMVAAGLDKATYATPRGTSFAAPLVAGMLAASLHAADGPAPELAVAALARAAVDTGAPGRDVVYGHGIIGRELRTDPALVLAGRR